MPIRVKTRRPPEGDRPPSPHWALPDETITPLPEIGGDDTFREVVKKLSTYVNPLFIGFNLRLIKVHRYIANVVYLPSTFEQLRTTSAGDLLRTLVDHLTHSVNNPATVNALL